jgi:hypothetical protein
MFSPDGICHSKLDGKRLARTLGCHEDAIAEATAELLECGVASLDEEGFLYSRRMKREHGLSEIRSKAGKAGAEKRWNANENGKQDFAMAKPMAKHGPPSSLASSSPTAIKDQDSSEPPSGDSKPPAGVPVWHPTEAQKFLTHPGPYEVDDADIATWLPAVACNDERGWPLTRLHLKSLLDAYQPALSAVAAATEVKKAKAWLENNPSNRKTPLGMPKFLNNWLSKAVNGGKR